MASLRQEQISAARDFADTVGRSMGMANRAQLLTAISGTSRMAGTFLFRSFSLALADAKPGSVMLSNVANESGPELIGLLGGALARLGLPVDEETVDLTTGIADGPAFLHTQALLEPTLTLVKEKHALSYKEAAQAAAVAAAILIKTGEKQLPRELGFAIAVYGFIEGSKTVPYPLRG